MKNEHIGRMPMPRECGTGVPPVNAPDIQDNVVKASSRLKNEHIGRMPMPRECGTGVPPVNAPDIQDNVVEACSR
ncbi:MAG TPA: hypothetical protein VN643_20430, partial [Pyrinomonadaceae bacterium]|nr:hypothetical protein [Pyrinomonadaceae bacterium]